jgi:hypothetical protein
MALRVKVDIRDLDPSVDASELARRIAEFVRNMTGSETSVRVNDNDPIPPSVIDATKRGRR